MKRIYSYLLIVAIGMIGLTSCSSDDNPPDYLLGKWTLFTISMKIYVYDEVATEIVDEPVGGSMIMQFDFKADNTVDYYFNNIEEETYEATGTYHRNGNDLTIIIDDEPQTFVILRNDADNLHLGMTEEEEYVKVESELKFIRM